MSAHFTPPPPAAITRVLATFDRAQLAGFVAVAIDLMDLADGDTDVEPNGDEADSGFAEDEPHHRVGPFSDGPGCEISDSGSPAWTEWQTRGRHKVDQYGAEIVGRDRHGNMLFEDEEDDDADMGVEDDPRGCDPEEDLGGEEHGEISAWPEKGEGAQPINMLGGVAADAEDDEPRHVPASMDRREPANAS